MSEEIIHVECGAPMLLRTYLRRHAGVSARLLSRVKHQPQGILCNGAPIRTVDLVCSGDILCLRLEEASSITPNPALQVPVVYENDLLVVYNKPAGMPVHPSARHRDDTLGNCYAAQYPECGFHALFRLDRNTSGLCAVAKTARAAHLMEHTMQKQYYALVKAGFHGSGTITAPIARAQESVITRCIRADGKEAVSHYHTLLETECCSLIVFSLETGRTHQIRVHMASLGYPLLGDDLYGGDHALIRRHALHCGLLTFSDPLTRESVVLRVPLPNDMQQLLPDAVQPDPIFFKKQ